MPIFSKNFVLYLLFLAILYKINSFINPNFIERGKIPVTLIENTQDLESWDDGEIPWDIVENKKENKHIPEKNMDTSSMDTSKMWEYLYYNDKASLYEMLENENVSEKEKKYYWFFLFMLMNNEVE